MIAVMDESCPADPRGIYYIVTAAIILDYEQVTCQLAAVLPSRRRRPFHWVNEGPQARGRMMDLLVGSGLVAHVVVHYPTGRRSQERARNAAITELVPVIIAEGAEELVIESRAAREDGRDRQAVIEALHQAGAKLRYRWDDKTTPVLWIADAICGVVKEYLLGEDTEPFKQLRAGGVLDELRYRRLS